MNDTQWTNHGAGMAPCGATIPSLPPGTYQANATMLGVVVTPIDLVTDGLIVLDDSPIHGVIQNVRKFWQARSVFKALGLVHKRGALLYGPPGSGKTAALGILAQDVVKSGGLVLFGSPQPAVTQGAISHVRTVEPDRPMVVVMEDLEDILGAGERRVLSMLDGENQVENVVYLATTNFIDKIPNRIKNRPSRFDEVVLVGMPDKAVRLAYLKAKIGDFTESATLADWADQTEGFGIAHLRELLVGVVALGRPAQEVITRLRDMVGSANSADSPAETGEDPDENGSFEAEA